MAVHEVFAYLRLRDAARAIEFYTCAVDAGATVVRPASDQFYGERSGTVRDPFGHDGISDTRSRRWRRRRCSGAMTR